MCVQDIDVQCVLQFTLLHAAGCALHRHTSRVIHRLELYHFLPDFGQRRTSATSSAPRRQGRSPSAGRRRIATVHAYEQKKWLRGDVHLPSPHVGTALRTAAPTIRTTTTGGGSLNLRKVADPKGARDPLTARPTITDNRPRDRYPEVATGIQ